MKFKIDQDLHVHTYLSSCSKDPKQTPASIAEYAKSIGIGTVCITDHYWDSAVGEPSVLYSSQNFEHTSSILHLPEVSGVKLLFGCECDLTLGVPPERFEHAVEELGLAENDKFYPTKGKEAI